MNEVKGEEEKEKREKSKRKGENVENGGKGK